MKRQFSLIAVLTLLVAEISAHADNVNSRNGYRKPANSRRQGLTSFSNSAGPKTIALTPILGGYSGYTGNWAKDILNPYTLGFSAELATNRHSGFEALAFHSHYHVNHQSTEHKLNKFGVGGNFKYYPTGPEVVQPFVGIGVLALYYSNLSKDKSDETFAHLLGAGQLSAGAELFITDSTALVIRGAWIMPVLNRSTQFNTQAQEAVGTDERGIADSSFYQILGSLKFEL